jgi:flagellin-like hook-associated protein FlgL
MRIATNVSAIVSNNALQKSQDRLTKSIARLSSGYKINSSSDDAAGYAISEKMRLQLRGLNQADNNAADGVSVLHTAEGAMEEIQSMLARMKELSVQAANGTNSVDERSAIQSEIDSLNSEIDRISSNTEFNSQTLISGNLSRRVYSNYEGVNQIEVSDNFVAGNYGITITQDARQAIVVGNGAVNTHFANASGLYDPNHYTTAYDMAMIARGCYNNSTFVNIDSTEDTYTIGPTNLTGESRTFRHRHQMLKGRPMYYEYCKGGKTGFTDQSGFTLVTFAEKNDMRLICVVFNCSDSNIRFTDTRTLFDWGFDNFKKITASSDTISSYFSGSNYYQSAVYSRYPENFSLSASTLTIPNHANVSDITLAVNENYTPEEIDNAYTTGIRFKYGDNTVATSLLTFSKGTAHTDNRLPYLSQDADTETVQPRRCFSISIWVIVAVFAAVVILICFIRDYQMSRRRSLHARRHHRRRR